MLCFNCGVHLERTKRILMVTRSLLGKGKPILLKRLKTQGFKGKLLKHFDNIRIFQRREKNDEIRGNYEISGHFMAERKSCI